MATHASLYRKLRDRILGTGACSGANRRLAALLHYEGGGSSTARVVMRQASDPPLPHLNTIDDADMTSPSDIRSLEQRDEQLRHVFGILRDESQQNDAGLRRAGTADGELAEVPVEGEDEAFLVDRTLDMGCVGVPGGVFGCRKHVVPCGTQGTNGVKGDVLVCEKEHQVAPGRAGRTVCSWRTSAA